MKSTERNNEITSTNLTELLIRLDKQFMSEKRDRNNVHYIYIYFFFFSFFDKSQKILSLLVINQLFFASVSDQDCSYK